MLTQQIYETLSDQINEKSDLIEQNLYENFLNSCYGNPELEYRTYIQFDKTGKIIDIFNDGFIPNVRKDLCKDNIICINALKSSIDKYDTLVSEKQKQLEEELKNEFAEQLKGLEDDEIADLEEEYNDILNSRIEQIIISDEELKSTYDTSNDFSALYEYLDDMLNL